MFADDNRNERGELNRLMAAAVVSRSFRRLLLTKPQKALEEGYQGQPFRLTEPERRRIFSIRAATLSDFAAQLLAENKVWAGDS